ncbi:MAG TPA: hypothetical protein VF861_16385 [Telluria sp.]
MRKLILPLILACAACTTDASSPSAVAQPAPAGKPAAKVAPASGPAAVGTVGQIKAMIGAATCTEASQCRTLPLGARACGGPEAYVAYSTANNSEAALKALGERYKQERKASNEASGMVSDCRFMMDPGAVCQAGTCQLAPGGPEIR